MKKENVVELGSYRDEPSHPEAHKPISEDLATAIQDLIYRLRELGPIQSS